jgi:hypothetical protein
MFPVGALVSRVHRPSNWTTPRTSAAVEAAMDQPSLGRVVRTRHAELGPTQEQLAVRIGDGVRQAEVSRLEADRVALPRRSRLEAIAAARDLPLGVLLARSGCTGATAPSRIAPPHKFP